MALVESLLTAIVRADGDALVLHVGERPYVVAASGQVELSSRTLTLEAISGILGQLISPAAEKSLEELGAVEQELDPSSAVPDERFAVVAARGGNDIWMEIRRHRSRSGQSAAVEAGKSRTGGTHVAEVIDPLATAAPVKEQEAVTEIPLVSMGPHAEARTESPEVIESTPIAPPHQQQVESSDEPAQESKPGAPEPGPSTDSTGPAFGFAPDTTATPSKDPSAESRPTPRRRRTDRFPVEADIPPVTMVPVPPSRVQTPRSGLEETPAIVLPLARSQVRGDQTPRVASPKLAGLDRLLRVAAARGASTLYLVSGSRPSIRVDGEISLLEGEAILSAPEVESHILDIMPERNREVLRSGVGTEWICDVADVGRIRCMSFRDHRGAGGIFRMIPARAISAEQLGLSREIQGLCAEAEGLVLVTGPRSSGKSTLISAFVDLINRTRSDHVITLESQIKFVHESRTSLVSQREVRGDNDELVAAARTALRENPDVLVIEDLRTPELLNVALAAAESGHLVIGSLSAHTTTAAIDRIIDQTTPERRPKIQLQLAEALRGIVAQVLVRKTGGGRLAAREVLLNTSSVANLIAEGKTSQLPLALDSGRRYGMVPLNDALVAFVQSGVVDAREAYRQAADRPEFLNQLRREGVDTSFVERLA
ncbi:MAG TPA: ATPase, T2SS/T4P/T4SS family [Vicinamibacterales bacterium]